MMTQYLMQNQINNLLARYSNGMFKEALFDARIILESSPNNVVVHSVVASCYSNLGQLDKAIESYKRIIIIEPSEAKNHYNLGTAYRLCNQLKHAIDCFRKTVNLQPNHAEAHYFCGYSFWQLNDLLNALESFKSTIAIRPEFAEAQSILGYTYFQLGYSDEAIKHLKTALRIKPNYSEAYNNLGSIYNENGQIALAQKNYQCALKLNPNFTEAHNNLGNLFNQIGRTESAINCYQRAIEINPNYIKAHVNLSAIKKYQRSDTQLAKMECLFLQSELNSSNRASLCFGLAKAYDDLSDVEKSFSLLVEGNCLRKTELNYHQDDDRRLFHSIKRTFNQYQEKCIDKLEVSKVSTIKPIFIVGMPRSGTSLVEQILASHSLVYGAGELNVIEKILIPKLSTSATSQIDVAINRQDLAGLRKVYLEYISNLSVSENIIIDKMPLNFRWIGFILSAFPNAKIINLDRQAMATCWSNYKLDFQSAGLGFSYDLKDLSAFYHLYTDLMVFWNESYPNKIYNLCYEDLTENTEDEIRKLLEYCELDWESSCLDYHLTKRSVATASANQVRKKIFTGSSNAWKKYASKLGGLIKELS